MRHSFALIIALCLSLVACGSNSPTTPTTPASARFSLSGTVTDTADATLTGVVVRLEDGPERGTSATTDASGKYSFPQVTAGPVTIAALPAITHVPASKTVIVASNMVVDFSLTKLLRANLVGGGKIEFILQPNGIEWAMRATASNQGDGCASSVSGSSTLLNASGGQIATFGWSLPDSMIVRPSATFTYDFCCAAVKDVAGGGSYATEFRFQTIACP